MALNLEAIRNKVKQLNGEKNAEVKVWKGTKKVGEHLIRILPWKDAPEGTPFKERWVYYKIGKQWIVSPKSFGKTDPIEEFQSKLWSGEDADKALAKKLFPNLGTCAAIIDRNAEDEGPQLWVMNKGEAADVLGKFLDGDYGDITDVNDGFDVKVKVTPTEKVYNGKKVNKVTIECKPRPSPAASDKVKLEQWMENLPNVDAYFRPMTYEQVKVQFESWLNEGGAERLLKGDAPAGSEIERGASGEDAVDALAKEVNEAKPAPAPKAEKPKAKKGDKEHATVDAALDDALAELEDDNI